MEKRLVLTASVLLIALIFLCLAWELWLAPLKPGGSWLALKAVFLLPALFGILRGRRYTYQWASLFILFYLAEGSVRAASDRGLAQWLAVAETSLSLAFFAVVVAYALLTRPAPGRK